MEGKDMKEGRKHIDILQVAATDKENLTGNVHRKKDLSLRNGRVKLGMKERKGTNKLKNIVDMKNNKNKAKDEIVHDNKTQIFSESDLTSDTPSEGYWEKLAESRRVALESALKENVDLHSKLSEMEYENKRLKEMLAEAQTLVEVLTEMLENDGGDNEESPKTKESIPVRNVQDSSAESDTGNESFQSCVL